MGTLRKLKIKLKLDKDFRKTLIKGSRNEILIDLDGDKEADIALLDTKGDGDIDTIALDLNGNGEFDLLIKDNNHNGVPDEIHLADPDTGDLVLVASGEGVEAAVIEAAETISQLIAIEEYAASELDSRLDELEKEIKKARKELRKRR